MSDANHQELMEVLRTLLKVQSLSAVRHLPTKREKTLFLAEAGLSPKEIAPIVGSSSATVSQVVYEAKKTQAKQSPAKQSQAKESKVVEES
jgi:DNA-directed RNA polymerase specialized sigma24 family protein